MQTLSPELYWLTLTAVATALMWIPYTLQLIFQMGAVDALTDPHHETPLDSRWAQRAKRAHTNAIENLAVFAPLVLAVHVTGAGTATTALASMSFFAVRVAHYGVYWAGVPVLRTVLFLAGFTCQVVLAANVLAH